MTDTERDAARAVVGARADAAALTRIRASWRGARVVADGLPRADALRAFLEADGVTRMHRGWRRGGARSAP